MESIWTLLGVSGVQLESNWSLTGNVGECKIQQSTHGRGARQCPFIGPQETVSRSPIIFLCFVALNTMAGSLASPTTR
jgi:hypothetical protein